MSNKRKSRLPCQIGQCLFDLWWNCGWSSFIDVRVVLSAVVDLISPRPEPPGSLRSEGLLTYLPAVEFCCRSWLSPLALFWTEDWGYCRLWTYPVLSIISQQDAFFDYRRQCLGQFWSQVLRGLLSCLLSLSFGQYFGLPCSLGT
jgi:hypothetical protein